MLADIVELRVSGQKLSVEQLRAAVPTRGELTIGVSRTGYRGGIVEPHQVASLIRYAGGLRSDALRSLSQVRVRIREGRQDFVLVGEQHGKEGPHPQAWWCRPVAPA